MISCYITYLIKEKTTLAKQHPSTLINDQYHNFNTWSLYTETMFMSSVTRGWGEGHLRGTYVNWLQLYSLVMVQFRSRCSSVVRAFAHGAMGRRIDSSWWTHWAISRSSQCPTTGVTKAVVCVILSVGWCI